MYLENSESQCVNCSIDFYKTTDGNHACTPCPAEATTQGKDKQTENTCGNVYYVEHWKKVVKYKQVEQKMGKILNFTQTNRIDRKSGW